MADNRVFTLKGVRDFNAEHIFDCGQCFRWDREDDGSYTGVVGTNAVNIKIEDGILTIDNCTQEDYSSFWRDYLDMDRDYSELKVRLSDGDEIMMKAVEYGYGIRMLKQDPWETVISFIISQN